MSENNFDVPTLSIVVGNGSVSDSGEESTSTSDDDSLFSNNEAQHEEVLTLTIDNQGSPTANTVSDIHSASLLRKRHDSFYLGGMTSCGDSDDSSDSDIHSHHHDFDRSDDDSLDNDYEENLRSSFIPTLSRGRINVRRHHFFGNNAGNRLSRDWPLPLSDEEVENELFRPERSHARRFRLSPRAFPTAKRFPDTCNSDDSDPNGLKVPPSTPQTMLSPQKPNNYPSSSEDELEVRTPDSLGLFNTRSSDQRTDVISPFSEVEIFSDSEIEEDEDKDIIIALMEDISRLDLDEVDSSTDGHDDTDSPLVLPGTALAIDILPQPIVMVGEDVEAVMDEPPYLYTADENIESSALCNSFLETDSNAIPGPTSLMNSFPEELSRNNTLAILFAQPLVGWCPTGEFVPLDNLLDHTIERKMLLDTFKGVHRNIHVHFDFATVQSLRRLLSSGYKTLHFSGHGSPGCLFFETEFACLQQISAENLKSLINAGSTSLDFVFVSACHSKAIGEAFIEAGVKHVICVKLDDKILDSAAMTFTHSFYCALLSGKTVRDSFHIAKEALRLDSTVTNNGLEADKFILLPNFLDENSFNIHHNQAIFDAPVISDWSDSTHCTIGKKSEKLSIFLKRYKLLSKAEKFTGREMDIYSIIKKLCEEETRIVSITGEIAIGKSSVATYASWYMAERGMFDIIIHVRCLPCNDIIHFIKTLQQAIKTCGNNIVSDNLQELLFKRDNINNICNQCNSFTQFYCNNNNWKELLLYEDMRIIIESLQVNNNILLVFDHLDRLLPNNCFEQQHQNVFHTFLNDLYNYCPNVKILNVSTFSLSERSPFTELYYHEGHIPIGLLDVRSSVKLFVNSVELLKTGKEKSQYLESIVCHDENNVTSNIILNAFCNGKPKDILTLAKQCKKDITLIELIKNNCIDKLNEYQNNKNI